MLYIGAEDTTLVLKNNSVKYNFNAIYMDMISQKKIEFKELPEKAKYKNKLYISILKVNVHIAVKTI